MHFCWLSSVIFCFGGDNSDCHLKSGHFFERNLLWALEECFRHTIETIPISLKYVILMNMRFAVLVWGACGWRFPQFSWHWPNSKNKDWYRCLFENLHLYQSLFSEFCAQICHNFGANLTKLELSSVLAYLWCNSTNKWIKKNRFWFSLIGQMEDQTPKIACVLC